MPSSATVTHGKWLDRQHSHSSEPRGRVSLLAGWPDPSPVASCCIVCHSYGMSTRRKSALSTETEFPRRVPAMITYLAPFRLVEGDELAPWNATIEQVNTGGWDYVKLHEVVGGIDVGLASPYHVLVGRDGALALPPIPELRTDQRAVEFFNRSLAALLLAGVYVEAVTLDHLEFGSVIDWKYIRVETQGYAAANRFHFLARMRMAPPIEAIALLQPRTVSLAQLRSAMADGLAAMATIPQLSGEFLLKGVSGVARRDWGLALSNLWITIEQLTGFLWEREVLANLPEGAERIDGQRDQLKDTRTWTAAARQEMLHHKSAISPATLRALYRARKARNELMHSGRHPAEPLALAAYDATIKLLQAALPGRELALYRLDLADHALSDPFRPAEPRPLDPQYWIPIPKLPGEEDLEREEAKARESSCRRRKQNRSRTVS
jgi:hypothetical protein